MINFKAFDVVTACEQWYYILAQPKFGVHRSWHNKIQLYMGVQYDKEQYYFDMTMVKCLSFINVHIPSYI
jgi:hypothetical protein